MEAENSPVVDDVLAGFNPNRGAIRRRVPGEGWVLTAAATGRHTVDLAHMLSTARVYMFSRVWINRVRLPILLVVT